MSVVDAFLSSYGAKGSGKGKTAGAVQISYGHKWRVQCDSPLDGPRTIIDYFRVTAGLPFIGDSWQHGNEFDTGAVCASIEPSYKEGSGGWWDVDVQFEAANGGDDEPQQRPNADGDNTDDPLQWHDEIDVSYTQISVPVEVAEFMGFKPAGIANPFLRPGRVGAVVNSALQPFDPTIEEEVDIKVIRITKNVASFDGLQANQWQGAVNSDAVAINKPAYRYTDGFSPLVGKIKVFAGTFQIANKIPYWKQTIEVHVNPLGWRPNIADRGTDQRAVAGDPDGAGGIISASDIEDGQPFHRKIVDTEGYPISQPVLLDGNGQPLDVSKNLPTVYLEYRHYFERPFAAINW